MDRARMKSDHQPLISRVGQEHTNSSLTITRWRRHISKFDLLNIGWGDKISRKLLP